MENYLWYRELVKPVWAPPAWLFGPVWAVLYAVIAITFGSVGYLFFKKRLPFSVFLPFLLNLLCNLSFTPIQFGLKNNFLAATDIVLVWGTLVWALVAVYPHARWIAYANLPYVLWASFATILQISITVLNAR